MLVATVSALVFFLPLGIVSGKLGRKNTILLGLGVLLVCAVLSTFIANHAVLYVLFALIGISWAAINVNSYPMVVELAKGGDIGKYTGIYYTFQSAAQIITPMLSGILIDVADAVFSKYIGNGLRILFPYAAVFIAAALIVMIFVKHGDSKDTDVQIFEEKLGEINAE
jgi:MFS family permease